jgi:CheY-like chemotaxis protein
VNNHRSEKNVLYSNLSKNSANESKSQKFSGVFTKINSFGCSEVLDCNDISISNNTDNNQSNNREVIKKKSNQNVLLNGNKFNLDSTTQNSTNLRSNIQGVKTSKFQNNSYVISDIINPENRGKNINININNNNIINIINNDNKINQFNINNLKKQDISSLMNKKNEKNEDDNDKGGGEEDKNNRIKCFSNNNINVLPEIDNMKQKRFSHNVSPQINQNLNHINPKECMTFFSNEKKDNVSKDKKTIFNDNFKENDYLFKEANKERKLCLKKIKKNNYVLSSELPPSSQFEEEELEEGEEYEEIEDLNKLEEEEQFQCNCSDILIVDDEKFNVMASQRMIKNIGYQTDAAYNGEECINLIKEKQKLNCKCNKNHYKLILLDIVMPELDGISTAKKVQEMITNKEIDDDIKIVFVSGNIDGEELKNSLLQIECVKDCLQKPVGIDKYRKILEKYYK